MRKLVKWLGIIMQGLLIVAVVAFVLLPAIYSSSLAAVYSGSMAPEMPVGSLAVVEPVNPDDIEVGDIIAFNPTWDDDDAIVSHRVIEVVNAETLGFITKGDANEAPDFEAVPAENVTGRVDLIIPNMGYILIYIAQYSRNQLGFALLIALPTILLIGSAVRDMNFMLNPKRRRKQKRKKLLERQKRHKSHWWPKFA